MNAFIFACYANVCAIKYFLLLEECHKLAHSRLVTATNNDVLCQKELWYKMPMPENDIVL